MILQISMIKYEKRTVERADEISYLLFQVKKNITGRVRDSHHPLQAYPSQKYWRKKKTAQGQ